MSKITPGFIYIIYIFLAGQYLGWCQILSWNTREEANLRGKDVKFNLLCIESGDFVGYYLETLSGQSDIDLELQRYI